MTNLLSPALDPTAIPPQRVAVLAVRLAATGIAYSLFNALFGGACLLILGGLWHGAAIVIFWFVIGIAGLLALYTLVTAVAPFPLLVVLKMLGRVDLSWTSLSWYGLASLARTAEIAVDACIALLFYSLLHAMARGA